MMFPFIDAEFQYISCYSLSTEMENFMLILFSFNTSHVTLYRIISIQKITDRNSFNTSHVTLYHESTQSLDGGH